MHVHDPRNWSVLVSGMCCWSPTSNKGNMWVMWVMWVMCKCAMCKTFVGTPCQFPHLHTICCRVLLGNPSKKKCGKFHIGSGPPPTNVEFSTFFFLTGSLTFICRLRTSILPCKRLDFILTSRTLQWLKPHLYYFYLWCVGCGRPATLQSVVVIQTVMSCNVMTEFNLESVFVRNCICKENGYLLPFSTCSS